MIWETGESYRIKTGKILSVANEFYVSGFQQVSVKSIFCAERKVFRRKITDLFSNPEFATNPK
jgi:hypothetical protein